jgi:hypothetical protein
MGKARGIELEARKKEDLPWPVAGAEANTRRGKRRLKKRISGARNVSGSADSRSR